MWTLAFYHGLKSHKETVESHRYLQFYRGYTYFCPKLPSVALCLIFLISKHLSFFQPYPLWADPKENVCNIAYLVKYCHLLNYGSILMVNVHPFISSFVDLFTHKQYDVSESTNCGDDSFQMTFRRGNQNWTVCNAIWIDLLGESEAEVENPWIDQ